MRKIIIVAAVAMLPALAYAQGSGGSGGAGSGAGGGNAGGAAAGGSSGNNGAGATGAAPGSSTGAPGAAGGAGGGSANSSQPGANDTAGIGPTMMPKFRTYVRANEVPSYKYSETVRVGTVLPESGVTYREVPAEFGGTYRYTVVNGTPVVVEPRTRRIIQVIQ